MRIFFFRLLDMQPIQNELFWPIFLGSAEEYQKILVTYYNCNGTFFSNSKLDFGNFLVGQYRWETYTRVTDGLALPQAD